MNLKMKEEEIKNQLPNYSEEKDIYYQEIEKTTFLAESELKDFKNLNYLCSNINKKYTAILYCSKDQSYLYLFVLKHFIDKVKENISYKIKAKLVFNKTEIDKTNSDDKQIFIDEQTTKFVKNEYKIMLVNRNLILLQVTGKKLIVINFERKEYGVLFTNSNDKKAINVVETYDELILIKNEQKSDSSRKKEYQIRTYVFCIASGILYFFLLNEKILTDFQSILIPFPFEEEIRDCIDFKILKITNKSTNPKDLIEKKYYFMIIVLLNKKIVRYITDFMNKSLKEILLRFRENIKNKFIKKTTDFFEKGSNNINDYKLKIYRSEKCASFILLQIDFHIFAFKFYESDTPSQIFKRFGKNEEREVTNIIEISHKNFNNSSDNTLNIKNFSINKNEGEMASETINSLMITNGKNISQISLNESMFPSRNKINQLPRRHQSISNIDITSRLLRNSNRYNNYQGSNESMNSIGNTHNSNEQIESTLTLTEAKDNNKDLNLLNFSSNNNLNRNNNNHRNSPPIKNLSSDKNFVIPDLKSKDKEVVYYSLYKLHNLELNEDKEKDKEKEKDNQKENDKEENKENKEKEKENINGKYKSLDEIFRNIKYSFTYHSFITFIKNENSVIVCYIPDKSKETKDIEKVTKYNRKLSLNNNENIQILDILHYDQLKYSFLLTNNFIYKFRVNTDLLHLLNISKHKNNSEDPKKETIYYKLKYVFKYSRNLKMPFPEKCKLCRKTESKIICPKCKRAVYCCLEHMRDDYRNIHFFQCEMNLCLGKLNSDRKKYDSLSDINNVIISFKNILNEIFVLTENKKDYINYTMYLKIMLNILEYIKVDQLMNNVLSPMRTTITNDFRQVCDKIFILELWFFYFNLNILYIDFIIKSDMYWLASKLVNQVKTVDLIENRDIKLPTMFAYFSLANDLIKYNMGNNKDKIEQYCQNYFFNLLEIYTNGNKEGNYLYIHEQFYKYYLFSFCSLLKINLFLKEKTKTFKEITPINIEKIVYHIPVLLEEKLNSAETNTLSEIQLKLPLLIIYYYLSFTLVKIDKIPTAINLLRYILEEIKKINYKKDTNNKFIDTNKSNDTYFSLEAKTYLNIGVLITYNGDFNLGIHYLENCYRLCFEKKLSTLLNIKVLNLLSLAYINYDKIDTAFILLKNAINLTKTFLGVKNNFNSTILIYKLSLFKLNTYLLFLYQYISYKYQKMNKVMNTKTKGKNNVIKDPDDIPNSIFPIAFNKMSPALIGYICEEDRNKKLAEVLKDQINKEDETFKFELDSNLDKFSLFCNNWKFQMIIKALEFLYKLSDKEYEILNNDNGSIQKEETKEDNYNQKERSSVLSKDSSMSYSKSVINKEKLNFNLKGDNENFFDEIEVKMGLYDQLSDIQQKELKSIQNNIFRRSILLRDPKGKIDKFNLNYHPKYTFDFYELFSKMSETIFLNQLEKFGVGEQNEAKIFEHKNDGIIQCLRKYINLEKIQNILYMEKVKLIERYKNNIIFLRNESRETAHKNPVGYNEYMNKLKEKFGKDKFLKNMNMEGLYEKLLKELNYRELDYILENPNKILNYIYINSKPFSEEQNSKSDSLINEKEKNIENAEESNKELINAKIINMKPTKEKEERKVNLSPRAIYNNNFINLISEKRSERSSAKKQTINYNSIQITNILNSVKIKGKRPLESKNSDPEKIKKKTLIRSSTLNKNRIQSFKSKPTISPLSNNNNKKSTFAEKKYNFTPNIIHSSKSRISEFRIAKNKKDSKFNTDLTSNDKIGVNLMRKSSDLTEFKNTKITSKIIPHIKEQKEIKEFKRLSSKNLQSRKPNLVVSKYKRDSKQKDTYFYEENIFQPKKVSTMEETGGEIKNKINISSEKINIENTTDYEYLRKSLTKTFDKYRHKNSKKDIFINTDNNKQNKEDNEDDNETNKKSKRKITFVQRKKPTFQEFREKILRKNTKVSESTFY